MSEWCVTVAMKHRQNHRMESQTTREFTTAAAAAAEMHDDTLRNKRGKKEKHSCVGYWAVQNQQQLCAQEGRETSPRTTTNTSCHIWVHPDLPGPPSVKKNKTRRTCDPDDGPLRWVQHISRGRLGALHAVVLGQVPRQRVPRGGGDGDWTQVTGALLGSSPDQRPPPGSGLGLLHRLGGHSDENQVGNHALVLWGILCSIKFGVNRLFSLNKKKISLAFCLLHNQ